jgi:transposase
MERSTAHLLHKRGKSLREIASELGRSKSTIARALSEPVDRQPESRRRKSNVDPFRDQIADWLKLGLSGYGWWSWPAMIPSRSTDQRSWPINGAISERTILFVTSR